MLWRGVIQLFWLLQVLEVQLVLKKLKFFSDVLNISDFTTHSSIDDVVNSASITICKCCVTYLLTYLHTYNLSYPVMTAYHSKITVCLKQQVFSSSIVPEYPFKQQYNYGDLLECRNKLQSLKTQPFCAPVKTLVAYSYIFSNFWDSLWEQLSCTYIQRCHT